MTTEEKANNDYEKGYRAEMLPDGQKIFTAPDRSILCIPEWEDEWNALYQIQNTQIS